MKELRELVELKKKYVELRVLCRKTADPKMKELLRKEIKSVVERAEEIRKRRVRCEGKLR